MAGYRRGRRRRWGRARGFRRRSGRVFARRGRRLRSGKIGYRM